MCMPLVPALMLAGTAVSAAGQVQSGLYASRMANYGAQVAQQNKGLAREGAVDAILQGQEEQRRLGREVSQRIGQQEARMGANNVDLSFGSAARVVDDTRMIGREDSTALAENTRRQVRAMQTDIWNYESERRAGRAEAKGAKIGMMFGIAETALGAATQYSKFKAGRA